MTSPVEAGRRDRPEPTFAGTPPFPEAARAALQDEQLRANLGRATTTIRTKRAAAVAERADWEALRLAGAAIKDEVLRDLPDLLERLERAVIAAGGVVHWARDAAEANAIVAAVARAHGAHEVVKVKSMATQEIELNEALRLEGIDVWETDLAEMIVQLGHDLPSHILVPAIHRNRTEIRDIFIDEMGRVGRPAPAGLSDDPPELAEAARLHLREKFLRARVAVSGANFAVAETGTVMVVESEGNGRMCLTLPEVLITVMGIEKLVPTWQDLEVFLQLLPRSSTAERMNPYTSMWTGVTPGDGPGEFHLILLDNGRTDVLSDSDRAAGPPLHPLFGLPQRLSGLRADRRPGVRLRLSRADRGDPHTAIARHRQGPGRQADGVAAVRLVAVRRLFRCLPGPDRHSRGPRPPARAGRPPVRGRPPAADRRGDRDADGRLGLPRSATAGDRRAICGDRRAPVRSPGTVAEDPWAGTDRRLVPLARPQGPGARIVSRLVEADRRRAEGRLMAIGSRRSTDPRAVILERIRAALADRPPASAIPRDYAHGLPQGTRIAELFTERVSDYRATVHTTTPDRLPGTIAEVLAARGARRLAVPVGIPAEWLAASDIERIGDEPPLSHAALDALDGTITGCAVAIAETGTIVLDSGPDQGRRALSLLPDLHVCVVRVDQVVGSVPEALARLTPTRPLTWISGPSATSDIELQRVEGVHGPRRLDVILVES